MNGFEKRREQKKEYILNALTDLIMKRNFKEIGVREIAKCASVSPASIYKFFGSKEELAKQVLYKHLEKVNESIIRKVNINVTFKEKIDTLYDIFNDNQKALNSDGLKNLMFDDPIFKIQFEEHFQRTLNSVIIRIIEQGKESGEISHTISTKAIMIFINCIISMMSSTYVCDNKDLELRKEFSTLFFYGILGERKQEK